MAEVLPKPERFYLYKAEMHDIATFIVGINTKVGPVNPQTAVWDIIGQFAIATQKDFKLPQPEEVFDFGREVAIIPWEQVRILRKTGFALPRFGIHRVAVPTLHSNMAITSQQGWTGEMWNQQQLDIPEPEPSPVEDWANAA